MNLVCYCDVNIVSSELYFKWYFSTTGHLKQVLVMEEEVVRSSHNLSKRSQSDWNGSGQDDEKWSISKYIYI